MGEEEHFLDSQLVQLPVDVALCGFFFKLSHTHVVLKEPSLSQWQAVKVGRCCCVAEQPRICRSHLAVSGLGSMQMNIQPPPGSMCGPC